MYLLSEPTKTFFMLSEKEAKKRGGKKVLRWKRLRRRWVLFFSSSSAVYKGVIITNAKHLKELFQLNEFIIFMLCKIKEISYRFLFYLWFCSIIFYLQLNPSSRFGSICSHILLWKRLFEKRFAQNLGLRCVNIYFLRQEKWKRIFKIYYFRLENA